MDEHFPARLKQLRAARGLSAAELADVVGVSAVAVWYWEHGRSEPRRRYRPLLAQALGVSEPLLMGEFLEPRSANSLEEYLTEAKQRISQLTGLLPSEVHFTVIAKDSEPNSDHEGNGGRRKGR